MLPPIGKSKPVDKGLASPPTTVRAPAAQSYTKIVDFDNIVGPFTDIPAVNITMQSLSMPPITPMPCVKPRMLNEPSGVCTGLPPVGVMPCTVEAAD